jgi:hypothetical protein
MINNAFYLLEELDPMQLIMRTSPIMMPSTIVSKALSLTRLIRSSESEKSKYLGTEALNVI